MTAGGKPPDARPVPRIPPSRAEERGEKAAAGESETVHGTQEAARARDRFLSMASHELRTPIASMQLQVHNLARAIEQGAAGSDKVSTRIRGLARATARMGELVNRLLDVSEIAQKGHVELVRERMDLAELAREVVERHREKLGAPNDAIVLRVDGPVVGLWDRPRLDASLAHLVDNAVKYGLGERVVVHVRGDDDRACVAVHDRGIGIAPEDHARIFGRFERAVTETQYGGFGLGLWLARLVVEGHGGRIHVESTPGEGSTFTVELPRDGGRS